MQEDLDICKLYSYAIHISKLAGQMISERNFDKSQTRSKTYRGDLVTTVDVKIEDFVKDYLLNKFPKHHFIGEESTTTNIKLTDEPTWILDPIDGTLNFVHSFPHCCISLALFVNREPLVASIYNPHLNQLFSARKNGGAFCNGKPIQVSKTCKLEEALILLSLTHKKEDARNKVRFENYARLLPLVHGLLNLGSAALNMSMVAMGGADVYFESGIDIWDFGAGELLVKEAGGVVCDGDGGPLDRSSRRVLCASSPQLVQELARVIVQYYPSKSLVE